MELVKFESVDALCSELEEKYPDGLWLDMDDKEQRKFAKEQHKNVNDVLKRINRVRIDAKKAYGADIDAQAKELTERINKSAKPLMELVEAHKAERKIVLDAEKAKREAEQKELEEYRAKASREAKFNKLFSQLMDITSDVEMTEKLITALKNNEIKNVTLEIK